MQQGSGGLSPLRPGQSAAAAASAAAGGVNWALLKKHYQERCGKLHTQPDKSILALLDKENRYPRASIVLNLANKRLVPYYSEDSFVITNINSIGIIGLGRYKFFNWDFQSTHRRSSYQIGSERQYCR